MYNCTGRGPKTCWKLGIEEFAKKIIFLDFTKIQENIRMIFWTKTGHGPKMGPWWASPGAHVPGGVWPGHVAPQVTPGSPFARWPPPPEGTPWFLTEFSVVAELENPTSSLGGVDSTGSATFIGGIRRRRRQQHQGNVGSIFSHTIFIDNNISISNIIPMQLV